MVSFGKPTIGARVYLVAGPSAMLETFPRRLADEALKRLLGSVPVSLAVEGFVRARRNDKQAPSWALATDYLSGLCRVPEGAMEPAAIISFWAAVILDLEQPQGN